MKEILLYSPIFSFTAEEFINKMNEVDGEDITVRLNSPGGSVFAGWGIIAKMKEHNGDVKMKIDGHAASMGFYMTLFSDYNESLDVSQFMIHRAVGRVESEDDQKLLDNVNGELRSKMEARIDDAKFQEITGASIAEIFESENRRDVWLTAKEAKEIGLVDRVVRLNPKEIEAINSQVVAFSNWQGSQNDEGATPQGSGNDDKTNTNQKKQNKMTKDELKSQHPEIYAEIVKEGVTKERDRANSFLAYIAADQERVIKDIKEGNDFNSSVMAELNVKLVASAHSQNTQNDNAPDVGEPAGNDKPENKDAKDDPEAEKKKAEELKAVEDIANSIQL